MKRAARVIVLIGVAMAGCDTAHNVAVSSYHAVTAPARYVSGHADEPSRETTANTSDVANPGQPMPAASPTPQPRIATRRSEDAAPTATPRAGLSTTATKPSLSPRGASSQPQFPVAKTVPGKPGLVYNPFDPQGGYIDVNGYASGSKVKDPDSQRIFIVP